MIEKNWSFPQLHVNPKSPFCVCKKFALGETLFQLGWPKQTFLEACWTGCHYVEKSIAKLPKLQLSQCRALDR